MAQKEKFYETQNFKFGVGIAIGIVLYKIIMAKYFG
jgi:hypothetical protein